MSGHYEAPIREPLIIGQKLITILQKISHDLSKKEQVNYGGSHYMLH